MRHDHPERARNPPLTICALCKLNATNDRITSFSADRHDFRNLSIDENVQIRPIEGKGEVRCGRRDAPTILDLSV